MKSAEIDALIRYHRAGLEQYRLQMSPSTQYLEAQTIKALEELKNITKPEEKEVLCNSGKQGK